jgi:hypothetical protein
MRVTSMMGAALIVPAIVVERAAASYFISDYEKRFRGYIAMAIITLQWFFSLFSNFMEYLSTN